MNRREFLKRMAAAGLVAAAPEIIVPERRLWQLDRTMTTATPSAWEPMHGVVSLTITYTDGRQQRIEPGQLFVMPMGGTIEATRT